MSTADLERPDRLTPDQLQTIHKVAIDLRDPDHREFAESLFGPLPDSAKYPGIKGAFILDISLDQLLQLDEHGIEIGAMWEQPQWLLDSLKIRVPGDHPHATGEAGVGAALFPENGKILRRRCFQNGAGLARTASGDRDEYPARQSDRAGRHPRRRQ